MDGGEEPVRDVSREARLRAKARGIHLRAVLYAALAAAAAFALPPW